MVERLQISVSVERVQNDLPIAATRGHDQEVGANRHHSTQGRKAVHSPLGPVEEHPAASSRLNSDSWLLGKGEKRSEKSKEEKKGDKAQPPPKPAPNRIGNEMTTISMSGPAESAPFMGTHYPSAHHRSLPIRIRDIIHSLLSTNRGRVILAAYCAFAFVVLRYNPLALKAQRDPYADERYATFATTFCGPDGICGEKADEPSPRTKYSARSAEQLELWTKAVEEESQRAITYNLHREAVRAGGGTARPLILLGDSIFESCKLCSSE